jgi:23S rRNA pseudouridine2457 synthase
VQVEGDITDDAIDHLINGVDITVEAKSYHTKKCKAIKFAHPPKVSARNPPIRFRKNIPDTWIKLILTEGKNRQVRKMTAGVGFPTLRLIRYRIEKISLDGLQPGEMKILSQAEMYNLLNIKKR